MSAVIIDTTAELERLRRAAARSVRAQWPYLASADIDDIVAEALARAVARGHDITDAAWLVGTARRVAGEQHRHHQRDAAVRAALRTEMDQ